MQAGFPSRGVDEGIADHHLAFWSENVHADSEVAALLLLAEEFIRLGIEEVRVRVQRAQHGGNGALVNLVGIDLVGKVAFNNLVYLRKLLEAGAQILLGLRSLGGRL